ncbi:MAG: SusD/RagB family nutrient-binding outer membrane lipoprotein [Capnocytophaga felis]|nr:SusD/RagB family nutrient-binding outer membrane lipoprotein [Capnocytophaga felis]
MKNLISKPIYCAASLLLFWGCSENTLDDINRDNNNANDVSAKSILADVITNTAFSNIGGDINTYTSTFVEHETGIHNQLYYSDIRQSLSVPSVLNNAWRSLYGTIKDARIAVDKCSDGGSEKGNYPTKGIAQVLLALNSAILTDNFGDVPYSQAAVLTEDKLPKYMTPKIDKQQDIYDEIFKLLDDAVVNLNKADESGVGSMGTYDFLYKGNVGNWTKLAYGLKARYTMQKLLRSANQNADLEKVLEYVEKSFKSATEQAAFNVYDAANLNPFFDFQWSRNALAASESLSKKLIARNDPRLKRVFFDKDWQRVSSNTNSNFYMAPNGKAEQLQEHYNTSVFVYAQTASTMLMSYHELLFLKAEALARLSKPEASQALEEAIIAAVANAEKSIATALAAPSLQKYGGLTESTSPLQTAEIQSYFETSVKPLFTANPVKEVMVQKYLATFGASGESQIAFNDIRRLRALGEADFIELQNPKNNEGLFPLRCIYGSSDTTTNVNVREAAGNGRYIYTENVWWAGGNR